MSEQSPTVPPCVFSCICSCVLSRVSYKIFWWGEEVCGAVCVGVRVYMLTCVEAVHYLDMHEHTLYMYVHSTQVGYCLNTIGSPIRDYRKGNTTYNNTVMFVKLSS